MPAGTRDGRVLRLHGKGRPGVCDASAGDALIEIAVHPHRLLVRKPGGSPGSSTARPGETAPRRCYLVRYVFRVAITEARIVGFDDMGVSIRHKHRKSARWRTTASAATSSCAASSSRCCRRGCTRCTTRDPGSLPARSYSPRSRHAGSRSHDNRRAEGRRPRPGCLVRTSSPRIAVSTGTPLSVLQGRPPSACAQALSQAGAWTMSQRDCQRSRLGVPATLRLSIAYSSPLLAPQARMYRPAVSTMHRNRLAPHHRGAGGVMAPRLQPITNPGEGLENP
jgi:hypothetical protein